MRPLLVRGLWLTVYRAGWPPHWRRHPGDPPHHHPAGA